MKKLILCFTFFLLVCLTFPLPVTAQIVNIPDPNLRTTIEDALSKASGATITAADMATLMELNARDASISDLTGLEHATDLTFLDLTRNSVSNIGPIANLTKLTHLDLDRNAVSDISAIAGLTSLTFLDIWGTSISDISPVVGLINLTTLGLGSNNISNISPVAGLANLTGLYLLGNHITDISSLSDLTNLKTLWLQNNSISDLSPLVANTGLGSGDTVNVKGNSLNRASIETHIPDLQKRGVTVEFDNRDVINMNGMVQGDVPFADVPFDVTNIPEPVPPPKEVRDFFQLDPYYQQWINVRGFPVFASEEVSSYALKEAAWILGHMIGHRPDVLRVMAERTVRFSIVPHNKHTSDMPESNTGRLSFFWDVRHRAVHCRGCPIASKTEEGLIGQSSSPIHNFGHLLQDWGFGVDPTLNNRVTALFDMAKAEGLYQGRYAGSTESEYWAEGVASWFHNTHPNNVAHTRLALKKYDPRLAKLLTEFFGDGDWRYTQPATRTHLPHLQGFNPQEAPIYQRPTRLLELEAQLKDPTSDGGGKWVNLELYHPSALSHLKKLTTDRNRTDFIFGNLTGTDLTLYTVDDDGKKDLRYYSTTDDFTAIDTHVSAIWLIQDHTGKGIAVFRVEEEVGRVLITPTTVFITSGFSKISGANQTGVSGALLANPFVVEVRDENLSVLEGIVVTFTVTAGGGTLSAERVKTNYAGRAESKLTLGPNFGTNTVSVSAAGIEGTVTFNVVAEDAVNIPDSHLRAAIEEALDKSPGTPIAPSELTTLPRLEARNANISNLTGLEHATNLTDLFLGDMHVEGEGWINSNSIEDLSPLAALTNLTWLNLSQNNITDLSPLAALTNLTWLDIGGNNFSNISSVSGLINLTALRLWRNNIEDISPVADLTHLTELNLNHNNISNISPVAGLTNLTFLRLDNNNITDISPLADLTQLSLLYLGGNSITDISPVAGLTKLTNLTLWVNNISDISLLTRLANLEWLNLADNTISDISVLAGLPNLIYLALGYNAITDHSILSGLTNLIGLDLRGTHTSDLSVLSGLTKLERLYIDRNGISDLSPLAGLTNLTDPRA